MPETVLVVAPDGLSTGVVTPGVTREIALETAGATMMRARAAASARSDWHHHGGRDVNPLDDTQEIIMTVVGSGPLVFNVDGPDA